MKISAFNKIPSLIESIIAWILADDSSRFIRCFGYIKDHIRVRVFNVAATIDDGIMMN